MSSFNLYKSTFLLIALLSFALVLPSCKTKQIATKKNEYNPDPPIKSEWPKIEPADDVPIATPDPIKFNVALIMPFDLKSNLMTEGDENADPHIQKSSLPALHFYEGALLAVDSINSTTKSVSIRSYESPIDSLGLLRIFNNKTFSEIDLVIATLPNNLLVPASIIASKRNINIMFTNASDPLFLQDNSNAALMYTSTLSQCKEMVDYMMNHYLDANVILIYRTVKREDELAAVFKKQLEVRTDVTKFHEFNASQEEVKSIPLLLSKVKKNVVFVVSSDEAFVSPIITLLNKQEPYNINVCGLPTWQHFESIDFTAFDKLNFFIFENNYIDYSVESNVKLRNRFISTYYSDPLPAAHNGFDLIFNLGNNLNINNPTIEHLIYNSFSNTNNYSFQKIDGGGFENTSISVLRIKNYTFEKLPLK